MRAQCGHHLLAAVSSEHDVKLYNYRVGTPSAPPSMEHYGNLRGHTRAVHDVKFHNVHPSFETPQVAMPEGGALMLTTASEDGTIKVTDTRTRFCPSFHCINGWIRDLTTVRHRSRAERVLSGLRAAVL